jgi:hypothetical protein
LSAAADAKASEPKPKNDDAALLEKEAEESKDAGMQPLEQEPGEDSRNQRVMTFKEFQEKRKEEAAQCHNSKEVRKGQTEIP